MNLYDVLAARTAAQPDACALIQATSGTTLSYSQLLRRVNQLADALEVLELQPAERIALHVPSGLDYIVWTYALWKHGACCVPIAFELARPEKETILATIGPSRIVSPGTASIPVGQTCLRIELDSQRYEVLAVRAATPAPEGFTELNPAFLRFTSGTTGTSKGVVLSHETIWARVEAANDAIQLTPRDRVLWLLSMSYHFAVSIVAYLSYGASVVLAESTFGKSIVEAAEMWKTTVVYGSPLQYQMASQDASPARLSSVRLAISTTTALSGQVFTDFRRRFDLEIRQAFGIIEVGLPCIQIGGSPDPGAVGRPLPAYQLRLRDIGIDPDSRMIEIRGPGMLDAYYSPWRLREEILEEGWFSTGDLGCLNADGELIIKGRHKDVISVSGMKFFPQEVEDVLTLHPGVLAASVFATPHAIYGELPEAHVVAREGQDLHPRDVKSFCDGRLAEYKIPRRVTIVDSLARTASGKVRRIPFR